jgi:hypothetical protein
MTTNVVVRMIYVGILDNTHYIKPENLQEGG